VGVLKLMLRAVDLGESEGDTMNANWFCERAICLVISTTSIMKKQGTNWELDQILFDALRIYSCTHPATLKMTPESALMNMDRPIGGENLIRVRKAMALIKEHPEDAASILEKFATF